MFFTMPTNRDFTTLGSFICFIKDDQLICMEILETSPQKKQSNFVKKKKKKAVVNECSE